MSWASRRRFLYLTGFALFFFATIGIPLLVWWYEPPNCTDGIQNQSETAIDLGGPCPLLDARALVPHVVQWARSFPVRDGLWSAAAYVENPNEGAAVKTIPYQFRLYDARNILIAERDSVASIMPGSVTPIFEGGIDTGNRVVARTHFEFLAPLIWQRARGRTEYIEITGKVLKDVDTMPRITAAVRNTSVVEMRDIFISATAFDTVGNAIAASQTMIPLLSAGEKQEVVFTWNYPFDRAAGRIDVLPLIAPVFMDGVAR